MNTQEAPHGGYQTSTPVAFIAHESEEMVHVRRAELRLWASEVLEIVKNPLEGASAWATTSVGIAATSGLSAIGLLAVEDDTHVVPSGVYLVMLSVTLAFAGIGTFCWWVDSRQRKLRTSRAQSLSIQIAAADLRSPRDPDAAAQLGLASWLEQRSADVQRLKDQLEAQLARQVFDYENGTLIERTFWAVNDEVLTKLQLAAPECIDFYKENPDWWVGGVTRIRPEEFAEVVRMMDYTLHQLAHVKEQVTP